MIERTFGRDGGRMGDVWPRDGASPLRALAQIIPVGNFEARRNFRASHAHANSSCDGKRIMGKRTIFDADTKSAHGGHDIKRQRIQGSHERNSPRPNGGADEVTTARDLQTALLFDQRAHADFRNGTSPANTLRSFTCSLKQA
jgi:hypothetical protein